MRYLVFIAITLITCITSIAQPDFSLTNKAAQLCQSGDLIGAEKAILEAMSGDENRTAYTWHVKGFIHKEIFKETEKMSPESDHRELAIEAVQKSMELDSDAEFEANNKSVMKFLARSYYSNAMDMIKAFNPKMEGETNAKFERFRELMKLSEPDVELSRYNLDFYKSMGKAFETLFYKSPLQKELIESSIGYYKMALEISSDDYDSNYNIAINYYNQGVFRIKKIDHKTEIYELLIIQEECIKLFRKALPFMLKAHKQRPERKETLRGLMAIYRALNDYEESDQYKQTLQTLIEEGKIKE
jgi:tetratricopeptide (TPR) repeat protein